MSFLQEQSESETVRVSKSLNEGEIKYVQDRMVKVEKCLQDHGIQCEVNNVPRIAVLGSGGGERAMIGLLGCIDQLYEANLLDSILYLCGVSGSTWCMTSMYEDASWSKKVPSIKDNLIKRLIEARACDLESIKWLSQAIEDENFSLTDIWAAHVVYGFVKKIDTTCLSDLKNWDATNPYPIYTVNDQVIKHKGDDTACWFELCPHEVGYSHMGAFVDTSSSNSQFEAGVLKQKSAERDMLYLQALCGSALADREEIHNHIWQWIKNIFTLGKEEKAKASAEKKEKEKETKGGSFLSRLLGFGNEEKEEEKEEGDTWDDKATEMVESILQLVDCEDYKGSAKLFLKINAQATMMLGREVNPLGFASSLIGKFRRVVQEDVLGIESADDDKPEETSTWMTMEEKKECLAEVGLTAYRAVKDRLFNLSDVNKITLKTIWLLSQWTWGTTYNFLYKCPLNEAELPEDVLSDEKTHLEDAGLVLNSPYVAALRHDRKVKLILSFDFSAGDPFLTVTQAAEHCKQTGIPFPPVEISDEDRMQPKDFYVFKSENTPTVIHMPLFNMVNCEGDVAKWTETYKTFRFAYDKETMEDLIRVSGLNVVNNKNKILQEILDACK